MRARQALRIRVRRRRDPSRASPFLHRAQRKSCTPIDPSENPTRNRKPPSGLTETTSIIGGTCDPEATAVRLGMIPVLRQLGMAKVHPIFYQLRLPLGKHASDDLSVTDPYQRFCAAVDY